MPTTIRLATSLDIERIAEIESQGFPVEEAATLPIFQRRFNAFPECFFVLEKNNQIVGQINGCRYSAPELPDILYEDEHQHLKEGAYQTVFGLVIAPDFQHQGLAHQLLEHFITVSKERGVKGLVLTCKDKLVGFYEQHGFVCQGVSDSTHGGAVWNDMLLNF
ncbi:MULTISPECIES: GNAT family N-acetyltransferase [Vibrio]|uniref:GNAT family N-acetyltransferase n=2 Tax=Vibrio TaxID=662 RepID=A0A7X4RWH9_9VIBR|nr:MULTISPECIES: GNAT family N-acetyltransferase [Vibrio]MBF9003054.1 GNAT family N-acetyltransferase [Vibrio nitrifigilis]MZI95395.1 GNAT family N-acetyltransferase [Vibrio eleionomae]